MQSMSQDDGGCQEYHIPLAMHIPNKFILTYISYIQLIVCCITDIPQVEVKEGPADCQGAHCQVF